MSDTKPWEEEWVLSARGGLWLRKGERIGEIDDPDRAVLVIAAPDMARALLAVRRTDVAGACWCEPSRDVPGHGHESHCNAARAALTKAGVPL